jgi:hypothetical protein
MISRSKLYKLVPRWLFGCIGGLVHFQALTPCTYLLELLRVVPWLLLAIANRSLDLD